MSTLCSITCINIYLHHWKSQEKYCNKIVIIYLQLKNRFFLFLYDLCNLKLKLWSHNHNDHELSIMQIKIEQHDQTKRY